MIKLYNFLIKAGENASNVTNFRCFEMLEAFEGFLVFVNKEKKEKRIMHLPARYYKFVQASISFHVESSLKYVHRTQVLVLVHCSSVRSQF